MTMLCHICGGTTQRKSNPFSLTAYVMRSGPRAGKVGFIVYPEGLDALSCNDCGEAFYGRDESVTIDAANEKLEAMPEYAQLVELLEKIKKMTRV